MCSRNAKTGLGRASPPSPDASRADSVGLAQVAVLSFSSSSRARGPALRDLVAGRFVRLALSRPLAGHPRPEGRSNDERNERDVNVVLPR